MTYTVSSPDPSGMVCEVTSTDAAHGFELVTDYLTDPPGQRGHADPPAAAARQPASVTGLKVYARWDATIDNTGGGGAKNEGANDATVDPATTALVVSDTQAPSGPFAAAGHRRGAGQPAVHGRVERLRGHAERRAGAARHAPPAGQPVPDGEPTATSCRPPRWTPRRAGRSRWPSVSAPTPRGRSARPGERHAPVRPDPGRVRERLERL